MKHYYALIMAGGGGTRLWPLSRQNRPKQVLPLTEERTMFQVTVERLSSLIPPEQVFVVTRRSLAPALQASTPQIPAENFILEPEGRDSGPAAGLGTCIIQRRDPDAVIAVLAADHHIADEARFIRALHVAHNYARQGYIVTLGIEPFYPATAFGYIRRGKLLGGYGEFSVYQSQGFVEKPDEMTAALFDDQWRTITKLSLDYAIMECAENVAVIPVDIGWTDVGNWATLFDVLARDENGNARRSKSNGHLQIDTHNTLIVSDKMVVTIGMDNIVIVDTEDAILVCQKDRAGDVKDVVRQLKARGQDRHL
jgi:mannose-1-phosphate guanylyltransferase